MWQVRPNREMASEVNRQTIFWCGGRVADPNAVIGAPVGCLEFALGAAEHAAENP